MPPNRGWVYHHRVGPEGAGESLIAYHVARFAHSDEEAWRRSIAAGRVWRNERPAQADERLASGDRLEFHRPPWVEPEAPLAFGVVHEDEHVLVVEKPAGLQVLPAGPFHEHTLLLLVRASGGDRASSTPVHRLGRGTSGLVLFGKTSDARGRLALQFRRFEVQKTYLALAAGHLPDSGIARHPIGPVLLGPWRVHAVTSDGKPSVTRLRVLRRLASPVRALVAAQPITGRPNQIRIHLAACGAPLVGDPLYAPGGVPRSSVRSAEGDYLLHAASLGFTHPATGRWMRVRSRPAWLAGALAQPPRPREDDARGR